MLVLSRKVNESIMINDEITITVVEIRGDKVRLGVEAPREAPVHRREVYEAIHRMAPVATPEPTAAAGAVVDRWIEEDPFFG
jgi:carbon storage regulator